MPRPNPIQRARAIGVSRGVGMSASLLDAHDILTVTNDGGIALATTAAPHGLTGAESVTTTGISVPEYNITGGIVVVTPTTFQLNTLYTSDGVGGRWDFEV